MPVSYAISKMKCEQNLVVGFVSRWKSQMGKGKEKSRIPGDAVPGVASKCVIGVYSDHDDLTR